jgi:nucleoporin POM152
MSVFQVADSQCPGTVISGENTYVVTWVDRPYASLAAETPAKLDPLSGSFLLPAVCENMDDHVDLDLTGELDHCP